MEICGEPIEARLVQCCLFLYRSSPWEWGCSQLHIQTKAEYEQLWFPDFWVRTRRRRNQVSAEGKGNRDLGLQYSQFSSDLLLGKKCSNKMRNNHCLISSNGSSVSAIKCQANAFNCCSIISHTLRSYPQNNESFPIYQIHFHNKFILIQFGITPVKQ